MSKGFALSIDALLAIVIAAILIFTIAFLSGNAKESQYQNLIMKKQINDVLIVMDKTGEFASMNSTLINASITELFPSSYSWRLKMSYYNYSNGFELEDGFIIGNNQSASDETIESHREFITFSNSSVIYYGTAELVVWLR